VPWYVWPRGWSPTGRRYKPVAFVGYALSALCKLGLLLVGSAWAPIAALLMIDRLGKGIRTAPRDALITQSSEPSRLGAAFGLHRASFLATGLGAGNNLPQAPGARLDAYTVIDDVVVPPEYEHYVIVLWGDRVFPHADDYVGYYADYTAFLPIHGRDDDGYLWVHQLSDLEYRAGDPGRAQWPADHRSRCPGFQPADRSEPREPAALGHRAMDTAGRRWAVDAFAVQAAAPGAYDAVRRKPPGGAGGSRRRVCRGPSDRAERAVAGASARARLGDAMGTPSR